jgi:hypothetical protein
MFPSSADVRCSSEQRGASGSCGIQSSAIRTAQTGSEPHALDNPFHAGVGGLDAVAMERTLRLVDRLLVAGGQVLIPCDLEGAPS